MLSEQFCLAYQSCCSVFVDVSFNEDHSRIRTDHAPENLAVVRHFALSALKQLPSPKRASIKRKRKICAYDLAFLSSAVDLILL